MCETRLFFEDLIRPDGEVTHSGSDVLAQVLAVEPRPETRSLAVCASLYLNPRLCAKEALSDVQEADTFLSNDRLEHTDECRAGESGAHLAEQVAAANSYGRHASCLRTSHAVRSCG